MSKKSEKDDIWKDPRFSHLVNDPRFKQLPKHERKVKIDKRFESMFNDSKFKVKYTVDKYGRKVNQSSSEDLKKYYEIGSSSSTDEDEEVERREEEKQIAKVDNENDELSDDGEILPTDIKNKLLDSKLDYARGEGRLLSDSSSDEESSEEENDDEVFIEHVWGELDNDAPRTDDSTNRLAACNMDWDRIRASDIMVLCNSFLPPGGTISSVKIYPSEFGKKRMEEEELYGPPELKIDDNKNEKKNNQNSNSDNDSSDNDDDELVQEQDSDAEEGDEYHMEKLRQYQLNRLKYYYAVIECDSIATADKLYKECDGLEYESTATKLDLRFIPDDVTFDDDIPKDVCTELPDLSKYKPRLFTTTALQQAKVELTWDEMSIERKELNEKLAAGKINEVSPAELRKFVAYSSEEDDDEDDNEDEKDEKEDNNEEDLEEESENNSENDSESDKKLKKSKDKDAISKYKLLLEEINKKEQEQKKNKLEMEYSWTINIDSKPEKDDKDNEKDKKKNMTPIEKILEKRHEKNKKRKEERRKKKSKGNNDNDNEDDDDDNDYSSDDIPDDVDLINDPYFAEEFANSNFEPPKKKSEKSKKKLKDNNDDDVATDDEKQKTKELELLLSDDDDGKQHFSLKKIQDAENETKSKRKRKKKLKKSKQEIEANKKLEIEDNFKINLEDDRFKSLYTSHLFNIDPSDPHFKKTKGMEQIIHEKLKRRYTEIDNKNDTQKLNENENDEKEMKKPKKKIENSILVKNIKRKIEGKHF